MHPRTFPTSSRRPGFTLVELLVVIGLIALLLTILIVSLRGVRAGATRVLSLDALRGMVQGYATYTTEAKQRLMPGFLDQPTLEQLNIKATLFDGTVLSSSSGEVGGVCDASSYVWRLAPYLDDNWKTYFVDYGSQNMLAKIEAEIGGGVYGPATAAADQLGAAYVPSFGMNSIFVGGDTTHGGSSLDNPLTAQRLTEVLNPSKLLVFGATRYWQNAPVGMPDMNNQPFVSSPIPELQLGYVELRAPKLELDVPPNQYDWIEEQWTYLNADGKTVTEPAHDFGTGTAHGPGGGWPVARHGDELVPIGNLDGSVHQVTLYELEQNMSRWAPRYIEPIR